MTKLPSLVFFAMIFSLTPLRRDGYCSSVTIENNRFKGIVVAIEPSVPEDEGLVESLKDALTEASRSLYVATENRAAFGEVTILVPPSWNSTLYNASDGECYGQADLRIAPPNPVFEDLPYTHHIGGCGEQGEYIHITPQYLTNNSLLFNTGPRGKTIVHEWAHYRWGVFDETSLNIPFYLFRNFTGVPTPTGCPEAMFEEPGVFYNTKTGIPCGPKDLDSTTFLYGKDCVYLPANNTSPEVNASIMSHHYLDQVVTFCRDSAESGKNQHNIHAPNKHNHLCRLRSTWTVIVESSDFAGGRNPSIDSMPDTTPIFRITQNREADLRFVLVLDVSGSMREGNKLQEMRESANYFIRTAVPVGSEVGLVSFSSSATVLNRMQRITTDDDRSNLISNLPTIVGGGTSIGSGIDEAIQVLENHASASGGNIFVFTDGMDGNEQKTKDIYNVVIEKKVTVSTMFFATNANEILANMSIESSGTWFATRVNDQRKLITAFNKVSSGVKCGTTDENFQIHATTAVVNATSSVSSHVFIDQTIGRDTVFTFISPDISSMRIALFGPNCSYANFENDSLTLCKDNPIHSRLTGFASMGFSLPGIAEPGQWFYTVESDSLVKSNSVTAVVSSKAANNGLDPIKVHTSMQKNGVGVDAPVIIRSQVSQGYFPVQGAHVIATLDRPGNDHVEIQLRDNGAGCDVEANDGVYSSYFTLFNTQGRYTVEVQASGGEVGANSTTNPASYSNGVVSNDGSIVLNPNGPRKTPKSVLSDSLGSFTRITAVGGFTYSGRASTTVDIYPPNQVTDLAVRQANLTNFQSGLLVTFTAPGDDYDYGTAFNYDLRYTFGDPLLLMNDFESHEQVTEAEITQGSLKTPRASGSAETLVIQPPSLPDDETSAEVVFGLRAFDEAGIFSETSNLAVTVLFPIPPKVRSSESAAPTTTGTSRQEVTTVKTTQPPPVFESPQPQSNELYVILTGIFAALSLIFLISTTYFYCSLRNATRVKKYEAGGENGIENPYSEADMDFSLRAKQPEFNY